jgi:hypothetical protein
MKYGEIIQNSFKNKKAYVLFPTLKDNLWEITYIIYTHGKKYYSSKLVRY